MHTARDRSRLICGAVLIGALVTAVGCDDDTITSSGTVDKETYEDTAIENLDLTDVQRVEADTRNGSISVRGQASTSARLVIRKTVRASTMAEAEEIAAIIQIGVRIVDGELVIRSTYPQPGPGVDVEVDYELAGPAGVNLDLDVRNGDISVGGMNGTMMADVVNGGITVSPGESGDAVTAHVGNGSVVVELPDHGAYDLSATTINGCIIGEYGGRIVDQCRAGIQTVELGEEGGTPYDLRVVNGTIQIHGQL